MLAMRLRSSVLWGLALVALMLAADVDAELGALEQLGDALELGHPEDAIRSGGRETSSGALTHDRGLEPAVALTVRPGLRRSSPEPSVLAPCSEHRGAPTH